LFEQQKDLSKMGLFDDSKQIFQAASKLTIRHNCLLPDPMGA